MFRFTSLQHTKIHAAESESAQFGRDARRDWQAVFVAFLALNLVSIGLNVLVFSRINTGELFLVDTKTPTARAGMNRFEIEKTVKFFEEKRQRFEALKNTPLSVADPGPVIVPKQ